MCNRKPIERDFVVAAKLNHLHVLFLVQLALAGQISEPTPGLVALSANILSLVVEAIMFKTYLVNSGTGMIWRVSSKSSCKRSN